MKLRKKGVEFSLKQLLEMGRLPKEGIPGIERWNNCYCNASSLVWTLDQTYEATPDELAPILDQRRLERNKKARERYALRKKEWWRYQ